MEMCLTGRILDATEAERSGLVSRVVPVDRLLDDVIKTAETIASMSLPAAMMTKKSINRAYETTLAEDICFERRVFHATFATEHQKEGMAAPSSRSARRNSSTTELKKSPSARRPKSANQCVTVTHQPLRQGARFDPGATPVFIAALAAWDRFRTANSFPHCL
jgi:hypothetical protein